MTDRSKEKPFDERSALDELEQFQSEITRYRQERQAATIHFEEFVRTLPPPEEVFPTEKPSPPPPAGRATASVAGTPEQPPAPKSPTPPPPAGVTATPPADRAVPASSPRTLPPAPAVPRREPAREGTADARTRPAMKPATERPPVVIAPERQRSKAPLLAALLVVALVIAGAAYWNARRPEPTGAGATNPPVAENAPPSPAAPVAPAPAPAATPETPAAAPASGSEITTLRPVWVRVIADGERVVERELPAGARIPFTAEKAVVIRTGDAGAVRLVLRGEDQGTLGRDGAVVTRTFSIPER